MVELARARLEDFVFRVRAARKTAGLTSRQVADALGIPRSTYRRFERTKLLPITHIATFCATVECSPFYLLTGELPPPPVRLHNRESLRAH